MAHCASQYCAHRIKSPLLQRTRAKQEKYISLALQTPKSAGLRGSGMGKHRLERGLFGQLRCYRREASKAGMPLLLFRASAANLPALRAQRQVQPRICSGAKRRALGRVDPLLGRPIQRRGEWGPNYPTVSCAAAPLSGRRNQMKT